MQRVIEDSTDTLVIYPPASVAGAPSSPQVRVATPSTSLPSSWENATADSVSAATNAAASAGDDELSFASDPGVTPGRDYLLPLSSGQRVFVRPLSTGTTVTLSGPLPMAIPSGTTLTGIAITHALTAAETSQWGRGLVKAKATIDGVEYVWDQSFKIVRAIFAQGLTAPELLARRPELHHLRPAQDEDFTETISAAWDDEIEPRLGSRGYAVDNIHSLTPLLPPWCSAAVMICKRAARASLEEQEAAEREVGIFLDRALRNVDLWYNSPGEDQLSQEDHEETRHLSVNLVR